MFREPFLIWKYAEYLTAAFHAPLYRLMFELVLLIGCISLYFKKSYKIKIVLTKEEEDQLIEEWTPTPFFTEEPICKTRIVSGKPTKYITVDGVNCLNFASNNFIDLAGNNDSESAAISILAECGAGSCGPRSFYGTLECHLHLEEEIASFMGVEAAILYSFSCCVVSSVMPSCIYSDDVVFLDEACSQWIAFGAKSSRARIYFYRHHDWTHLEELLSASDCPGKFIVVEGVNHKFMDVPHLPTLIKLRYKYKARIILDESLSIGVIKQRGLTELFDCDISDIDAIIISLENSFASIGGLCLGSSSIVGHQRLAGTGYVFSASCSPINAAAVLAQLPLLTQEWRFTKLAENTAYLRDLFDRELRQFQVGGDRNVPILMLIHHNEDLLNHIVEQAQVLGVALVMASQCRSYYPQMVSVSPRIKITVSCAMDVPQLDKLVSTIRDIVLSYKKPLLNNIC